MDYEAFARNPMDYMVVATEVETGKVKYFDGALGDPIPVEKALEAGCEKVVLVLTRPENTVRTSDQDEKLAAQIQKKYPFAAQKLRERAERYNEGIRRAMEYAKQGKVLIVAPDNIEGMSTLKRDVQAMNNLYQKGRKDAEKIKEFLSAK